MSNRGPLKTGAVRDDGFIFCTYRAGGRAVWMSPKAFHRQRVSHVLTLARARAKRKSVPCALDTDFLLSAFPADGKCPALGFELVWGNKDGQTNSPTLDRLIPELGYVKGNVVWVSDLANRIKTSATTEQIGAVYKFYKDLR